MGGGKTFLLFGGALFVLWYFSGGPTATQSYTPNGSTASSFDLPTGRSLKLKTVDRIPWPALKGRGERMTIYCTPGTFIIGEVAGSMIGLNGTTSTWAGRAVVTMADGRKRDLLNNEHPGLKRRGLIDQEADVFVVNDSIMQGIRAGLAACQT